LRFVDELREKQEEGGGEFWGYMTATKAFALHPHWSCRVCVCVRAFSFPEFGNGMTSSPPPSFMICAGSRRRWYARLDLWMDAE
jgi:hypothetical protein